MVATVRSLLFAPGSKPTIVAKALASAADSIIFDLEDAVPVAEKDQARANLAELPDSDTTVFVRVNGADTEWFWPDVVAAVRAGADAIVVPKAESANLLRKLDGAVTALETEEGREASTTLVPLMESALGVFNAHELLTASERVSAVLYGSAEQGDLVADLGSEWSPEGTGLLTSRAWVLLAARAAGIAQPLDAVFMNFKDLDGLRRECQLARTLGYTGKAAIHPAQLDVIHEVFTPSAEEVAHQRTVLARFEEALAKGDAAVSVDGVMVDYASARRAREVIARAEAAARSDRG